jgi:sortase A
MAPPPRRRKRRRWLRTLFYLAGFAAVGYYGYTLAEQYVYERYENWAFDQEMSGRRVAPKDWVMMITPLGAWTGYSLPPVRQMPAPPARETPLVKRDVPMGTVLGRVDIPRLHLSAMVRQGADEETLKTAVGHVPSTQFAGEVGNFAIAAHRDTLFRALKDIRIGDTVTFQSTGGSYEYKVASTQIVKPTDVSVLRPQGNQKLLTMITCYPFYFVGSAPKRFIVTARLSDGDATAPTQSARAR